MERSSGIDGGASCTAVPLSASPAYGACPCGTRSPFSASTQGYGRMVGQEEESMALYCRNCGNSMADDARFCSVCGTASGAVASTAYPRAAARQLTRPRAGRMIAGVCQGIANQYSWDVAWVRVITVIAAVFGGGLGVVAYIVLWVVTPEDPLPLPPPGTTYTPTGS